MNDSANAMADRLLDQPSRNVPVYLKIIAGSTKIGLRYKIDYNITISRKLRDISGDGQVMP